MKITVFTSSEQRHIALVEALAPLCETIYVSLEVRTFFSGVVDDFFQKSDTMAEYFSHVDRVQKEVFGEGRFLPANARVLGSKLGDLSHMPMEWLQEGLDSDLYIVFGASFIKGDLINFLVENQAINIHMGISPYYRGNSCNFWAAYDRKADLVGSTIHRLTAGLDSGPMLFHSLPAPMKADPFKVGMCAVKAAHNGLVEHIQKGDLLDLPTEEQDKAKEMRYTRNADFNDEIAREYLETMPTAEEVYAQMQQRDLSMLLNPYIDESADS